MTKEKASMILSLHLMQCGMMMPIEWVQKNGEDSEFMQAYEMAMDALKIRLLCVKIANTLCSPIYTESVNEEIWESLSLTISAPTESERTVTGYGKAD